MKKEKLSTSKVAGSTGRKSGSPECFNQLRPSSRNEIIKYISYLKTEQSIDKNVAKAINFLLGKERFVGRDKPELKLTKNP